MGDLSEMMLEIRNIQLVPELSYDSPRLHLLLVLDAGLYTLVRHLDDELAKTVVEISQLCDGIVNYVQERVRELTGSVPSRDCLELGINNVVVRLDNNISIVVNLLDDLHGLLHTVTRTATDLSLRLADDELVKTLLRIYFPQFLEFFRSLRRL